MERLLPHLERAMEVLPQVGEVGGELGNDEVPQIDLFKLIQNEWM